MSFAAAAIVKATLALLLALAAAAAFRRAAAATRHAILVAGQLAALLVPPLAFVVPHVNVEVAPLTYHVGPEVRHPKPPPSYDHGKAAAAAAALQASSRDVLTLAWLLGVAAVLAKRGLGLASAIALVRRAKPFRDVLVSEEVDQPVTLGSRIVLPSDAARWSEPRLRAVLAHERAHVDRRDGLQAAIGDVVCAVYWFHPLAWLSARQAALAREQACDDAVLEQGITRDTYATAILDVARSLRRRVAHGLPMATRSQLEVRLRAILDDRHAHHATRSARFGVIVIALACAPLLAAITPRGIEPDLLGDAYASPFSEHIAIDTIPDVPATGPDAALIATMRDAARISPRSEDDFVADRARWALGRVRNGELMTPLIAALHDGDWRIRAYAAWGLGVARDARATDALLPLMNERIWRVRAMAATALAQIADPTAAPAMKRALDDDAWQVRRPAVQYFHAIGANRALFESMLDDRHIAVRAAAEEALQ
ncbi:MAG TPA: HEAT repeat domain-containing protein [Thermoanaerobaculia bacterium]|nr:HEAT repeat domain-containing protein [Thermoanaerobaculia bacterium]